MQYSQCSIDVVTLNGVMKTSKISLTTNSSTSDTLEHGVGFDAVKLFFLPHPVLEEVVSTISLALLSGLTTKERKEEDAWEKMRRREEKNYPYLTHK